MKVLDRPLTIKEIREVAESNSYVTGVIRVRLGQLIGYCTNGFEEFLDLISKKLVGSDLLMDIGFELAGAEEGYILLKVTGDPSMIIEHADELEAHADKLAAEEKS